MLSIFFAFLIGFPAPGWALTGGPSQPEFTSFTPVEVSNMVDLFSGDFQYNIPLLDVEGYPINLSYATGMGMEDQASSVGFGWTLNAAGIINRAVRGIPDDFNGDRIVTETNMKTNWTIGVGSGAGAEFVGFDFTEAAETIGEVSGGQLKFSFDQNLGINYNSYTGLGYEMSFGTSSSALFAWSNTKLGASAKLGINSETGIGVDAGLFASMSYSKLNDNNAFGGDLGINTGVNSRSGLRHVTISASLGYSHSQFRKVPVLASTGLSYSGHAVIPVGFRTYIPQATNAFRSYAISGDMRLGGEMTWVGITGNVNGYYSTQYLSDPEKTSKSYGYLYAHNGKDDRGALHDFNREKDGAYNKNVPSVAMSQMTYDVYTVSGQGVSGMFRPFRDFGTVYDPYVYSSSDGGSLGGDITVGNTFKAGINFSHSYNLSTNGRWSGDQRLNEVDITGDGIILENNSDAATHNESRKHLSFNSPDSNSPLYEPAYFKSAGEFSVIDQNYYEKIQGLDPVRMEIDNKGKAYARYQRRTSLANDSETVNEDPVNRGNRRQSREARTQTFSFLTFEKAKVAGIPVTLYNKAGEPVEAPQAGEEGRESHHIAEITINRPDGVRYVFGSQTYNFKQKEVTFNAVGTKNEDKGYVTYKKNADNSTGNHNGIDYYYNSNELPPHATAYQLTSILSDDYVDVKGDGLSPDDLGSYTKFNYKRIYDKATPYKWRNPYTGISGDMAQANLNEGFLCKTSDDKGTYIYGEKEIRILHSIETKNYTAQFHYTDRFDAWDIGIGTGKERENGGMGQNPLQKLDSIQLFSRHDWEKQQKDETYRATPIKTVHFKYDYSLCKEIPSYKRVPGSVEQYGEEGGKLTLKEVCFTYGKSKKGKLSPYKFTYSSSNPGYHPRRTDRWGTYKHEESNPTYTVPGNSTERPLTNIEMPYTLQKDITGEYASAWCLKKIELPSGGEINVEYESDDYAYVEGAKAASMVQIRGFGKDLSDAANPKTTLYDGNQNNCYIFFDAPGVTGQQDFLEKYLGNRNRTNQLFFKFYMDLGDQRGDVQNWEYVSGYVEIENAGYDPVTQKGYIKLPDVSINDDWNDSDRINPITRQAMQFVRVNMPDLFHGGNRDNNDNDLEKLFYKFLGNLNDVLTVARGYHEAMRSQHFGKTVNPGKSFIRLTDPDGKKMGGGVRVKRLTIGDEWEKMSGGSANSFSYGQTYKYTRTLKPGEDGNAQKKEISSGVASNEPPAGGEENALHSPNYYSEKNNMAPDNRFYMEKPYGESFMPSPTVGYSRVVVENIQRGTGYTEHEFYTAKDFPVIIREPYLKKRKHTPNFAKRFFKVGVEDYLTVSQSYAIELNDMHGKPKATRIYADKAKEDANGETIALSKVEYFYKTDAGNSSRLSNKITAIGKDGKIQRDVLAGVNIDMTIDERESKSIIAEFALKGNLDASIPPPLPAMIPLPAGLPASSKEVTCFRSISNTKVITRYGILDRIVAEDLGARTETQNMAWDAETGEVLLTRTENDFKDPVYSFTYPAHWGYDGMAGAYKNIGMEIAAVPAGIISQGFNPKNYFTPGDEIIYRKTLLASGYLKGWITGVGNNSITVQDENGTPVSGNLFWVKVIRSGRRNQPVTPIGSVVSLYNPIQGNELEFRDVLNSSAIEYGSDRAGFCKGCALTETANPYLTGEKGTYRPNRSYAYLTGRTQTDYNRNTNIRRDGTFTGYTPFRTPNGKQDWTVNPDGKWTFASEVTLFSPYGFELENKDALGRYTSAIYGYNNTLPVAVAGNARYRETGFTGFEDGEMEGCSDAAHFSFGEEIPSSPTHAHTGKQSIPVGSRRVIMQKILIPCGDTEK
jgi:hypothetical protein